MQNINKKMLAGMLGLVVLGSGAMADAANLPSADSNINKVQQNRSLSPEDKEALATATQKAPASDAQKSYSFKKIVCIGQDLVPDAVLDKALASYKNTGLSIDDINNAVAKAGATLRQAGYPAVAALLPQQDLQGDTLTIQLVVGKLDKVILENDKGIKTEALQGYVSNLKPGAYITSKGLETSLLNLDEISGSKNNAILAPSEGYGATNITIRNTFPKKNLVALFTDNSGTKYSGRYRFGINGQVYNADNRGSNLNYMALYTTEKMFNGQIGYEMPLGSKGSRLGVSYSHLDYTLGDYFEALEAVGTSDTYSIYGSTPLKQTNSQQMRLNYGYDYKKLTEEFKAFGLETNKKENVFHLGLSGKVSGGRNISNYALTYYAGNFTTKSNIEAPNDGGFQKLALDVNNWTGVAPRLTWLNALHGQIANRDLDSSEEMSLGGPNGVRAYALGEASGDYGYQFTSELQYTTKLPHLTLAAFYDNGHTANRSSAGSTGSSRTLQGIGLGVQYAKTDDFFARIDYAVKLNGQADRSEGTDSNGRFWFRFYKMF